MIVHMVHGITEGDHKTQAVIAKTLQYGLKPEPHTETGTGTSIVEVYLKDGTVTASSLPDYIFRNMDGVSRVVRVSVAQVSAYMNGAKERHIIPVGKAFIGLTHPCMLVSGQCSIDAYITKTVEELTRRGVLNLRGCFRKPRSRAEAFRGLGTQGLVSFFSAAKANGVLSVWTEVVESPDIDEVRQVRDRTGFEGDIVLWVGARNTGNYRLLQKLGEQKEFGAMLKHGLRVTDIDNYIDLASFVLYGPMWWNEDGTLDKARSAPPGNDRIIFCIRGLEKSDPYDPHRFQPNPSWIDQIHDRSWAPVCYDPSHSGGRPDLVLKDLSESLVYSPDAVMVESHVDPSKALTDKEQALSMEMMDDVIGMIKNHNESICPAAS